VMQVEPGEGSIRVKRELEDGWYQHVVLPLPAVLTIQSGIKKLRYATLMGIKKAKTKEIRTVPASGTKARFAARLHLPEKNKQSQIFSGEPKQAARELVEKLRFEARVL
jgi:electron transfer flavoprotein beta subunit